MSISQQLFEEDPYNRCIRCPHIGKKCDGPNFLAMSSERWSQWCRLRKEYLGWTNAHLADISDISKVSVDRVLSGNVKDIRTSTLHAITEALVDGSWGQYPCAMDEAKKEKCDPAGCDAIDEALRNQDAKHQEEKAMLREDTNKRIEFLQDQLREKDKLLSERYDFLKRKDRLIRLLSILLGITVALLIVGQIIGI